MMQQTKEEDNQVKKEQKPLRQRIVLPAITIPRSAHTNPDIQCPLICEQGPSAPSSPTTPEARIKRPRPLTTDAMDRINLLSAGGFDYSGMNRLSPLSPGYATSDLGSSPRSSISAPSGAQAPWTAFREHHKSSFDLDDGGQPNLLSPYMTYSPAPYSPFSDYSSRPETPFSYGQHSPNLLSPNIGGVGPHFTFDVRAASSASLYRQNLLHVPENGLNSSSREKSRSDSDMGANQGMKGSHSTTSVPATMDQSRKSMKRRSSAVSQMSTSSFSRMPSRQTTLDDDDGGGDESDVEVDVEGDADVDVVTPEPTELNLPPKPKMPTSSLPDERTEGDAVNEWVKNQLVAVAAAYQAASLLKPSPALKPFPVLNHDTTVPIPQQFVCPSCGQVFAVHDRLAKHIASRHKEKPPEDANAKVHTCNVCAKSFGRSDMLTRHMRLHTGAKPYECNQCGQVFSRSDHLSTHMRTHTGEKPYSCPICNYSASRRDMISRHMRTHATGQNLPIDISGPISQLSIRSLSSSPLPPPVIPEETPKKESIIIGSGDLSAFKPLKEAPTIVLEPPT